MLKGLSLCKPKWKKKQNGGQGLEVKEEEYRDTG